MFVLFKSIKFMKRVALIIPYFTIAPPQWIPLNFYTCARQRHIDFIYFTDCEKIVEMAMPYSNIICHRISFSDYCDMVSERLNIDFHPKHAYKLCDLKPFMDIYIKIFWMDMNFGDMETMIWCMAIWRCCLMTICLSLMT